MTFCGSCGKQATDMDKSCRNCGTIITEITGQVDEEVGDIIKEEYRESINNEQEINQDANEIENNFISKSMRELGNKLEDIVEKIYQSQGYETKTRQKILGKSKKYNEMDVLATRKSVKIAIECKNYSEDRKVGIKEIRDFVAKLNDLNIHNGLFVTSSYFSEDARIFAENDQNEIKLWDKDDLTDQIMTNALGRDSSSVLLKSFTIENALPLQGSVEDYCILYLKNQDKVTVKRRDIIFVPIYITLINLYEEFNAPDKLMYTHHNTGQYYLDGTTGSLLMKSDNVEKKQFSLSKEEKQVIEDLQVLEPQMIKVEETNNLNIIKLHPGIDRKNIEFQVRNQVAKDNKKTIEYKVKLGKEQFEKKHYPHMPHHGSIQCQTRIVYVPKLVIEFESKEHIYEKIVMMASGVIIQDTISDCKHILGKKTTFAVCDVCGVAKCEKDITLGNNDDCYCKNHIPVEIKETMKENSKFSKLLKFGKK
ncbi:MAG TPA: restriction endonuclease [Nitrosopumilus sp.]|nr:restriction endonuclease [Nitrosopumilus sp.]HJJ24864.1 restriction endonuclease [Nitrosopumilus sp.]